MQQLSNTEILPTIVRLKTWRETHPATSLYENREYKLNQQRTYGYYGIEICYRNNTVVHETMMTTYVMARGIAEDTAHSNENTTKMTPHHVRLFLLEPDGNIHAYLDYCQPKSRRA